ncbi:hypothetical protein MSUIS_06060 [Mycoplasma suis KI3806]|uniref:Uncharacterized protein n=1 Tax=Mycoplasma suis (strain KI_3806) TaxID=708248 RepID=F0V218_MYCS3|nr:hypothetical protein MSUIS_06060 [Mycoplasma suis KI3806]
MAGTTGLSAYLIPYSLGEKAKDFLFSIPSDSNVSENIKEFSSEEQRMLETLKPLLEELESAVKNSTILKEIKNGNMESFFKKILEIENNLVALYKRNLEIIKKLFATLEESIRQSENKLKIQSNIEKSSYSKKLLNQLEKFINSREQSLSKIVQEIDKNQKASNSSGGAQIKQINKLENQALRQEKKPKKH